ncbi:hypothetical protein KA405_01685 [Patescibacteria group bacterium]|nr:hypothetical protein [Patescibacteria group bacterium]
MPGHRHQNTHAIVDNRHTGMSVNGLTRYNKQYSKILAGLLIIVLISASNAG